MIEKTYRYHCLVFTLHRLVYGLLLLCMASVWMLPIWYLVHYGFLFKAMFHFSLYVTFVVVCLGALFRISFGHSRETTFTITDDLLIKKTAYRVVALRLSEITKVRLALAPGVGGGVFVRSLSGRIVLPFFIDGIGSLIADIEQALFVCGTTTAISVARMARLKKLGHSNDVLRNRFAADLIYLSRASLSAMGFSMLLASVVWGQPFWPVLYAMIGGGFFTLLAYTTALFILNLKLQRSKPEEQDEALRSFNGLLFRGTLVTVALYCIAGIIFKTYLFN